MNRIILIIACLPLGLFVACGGEKAATETSTEETVLEAEAKHSEQAGMMKTELQNTANEVATYTAEQKAALMEKKDALVEKMQSALSDAGSVENLKGAATNALSNLTGGGNGADTKALMEKVNQARSEVTEQIAALKDATPDNWEDLKAKAESALAKFQKALAEAKAG
jgi:uncharacterized protein YdbL (DUF1318 family)